MLALKIALAIFVVFTAISLACAVGFARRRGPARIGRWCPPPVDPFSHPFGELVPLPSGSLAELHAYRDPARPAVRVDQGSGGNGNSLSGAAAARTFHTGSDRRAR